MTLSPREQELLDGVADGLAEQDPPLVAEFARSQPRGPGSAPDARRTSDRDAAPEPRPS
jgi:hypothetical protein